MVSHKRNTSNDGGQMETSTIFLPLQTVSRKVDTDLQIAFTRRKFVLQRVVQLPIADKVIMCFKLIASYQNIHEPNYRSNGFPEDKYEKQSVFGMMSC